jgi:Fe-S cluster assembly scaffold protein SufB
MSRGISYNEAIKIIIKGIILSNINPNMEYREKILNILEEVGGE